MRHWSLIILLSVVSVLVPSACTHNNGDIGDWFGTWLLESMAVDGEIDACYQGNVIWKFQSDIVCIGVVNDLEHTVDNSWGTWSEFDGKLTLDFSYSDNNFTQPGTGIYAPPAIIRLPSGISTLDIESLSGSSIRLRYLSLEGHTIVYKLVKWG